MIESDLVRETFNFWYTDHDHVKSPFPAYIKEDLKNQATQLFMKWVNKLPVADRKAISDNEVAQKLEEIIFDTALDLVQTEDERITILYPFLPRLGDKIMDSGPGQKEESKIIDRYIYTEDGNAYLKVRLEKSGNHEQWDKKFELPS